MDNNTKTGAGCAIGALVALSGMIGLPFLAVAAGGPGIDNCPATVAVDDDGTPSILGPATVGVSALTDWWADTGRGQPTRLTLPIEDVIALYLSEGEAEGVRADYALAQAILETGYFTNTDTSINNFAGIAHYDGTDSGARFPDAVVGVHAHIQLLKKFAAGNDVALARPDVAPDAGATATTWGGLAGTWATATDYWTALEGVYQAMAGGEAPAAVIGTTPGVCVAGPLATSGDYALPVERAWYDQYPEWFTKPHHDYPAADIPVPTGTPIYSASSGTVASLTTSGACGIGVVINGDGGAQYTYCHGLPGSHAVDAGDPVESGQPLMLSASTGNSTGPHLHFSIRIDGQERCPQPFLVTIVEGQPLDPHGLPGSGCTY